MTEVFIVGEDPVTQEILRRLINDYAPRPCCEEYIAGKRKRDKKQNGEL